MRRVSTACPTVVDSVNPVTNSDTTPTTSLAAKAADKAEREAGDSPSTPPVFTAAVESMHAAQLRPELTLGTIRPPQRLAPFSHAIGIEVGDARPDDVVSPDSEGDAFGRLILLHDPAAEEAWEGDMRLVVLGLMLALVALGGAGAYAVRLRRAEDEAEAAAVAVEAEDES